MKTLFVYPAISLTGFGQKNTSGSGEAQWINHGVGFLVTCARNAGFDVSFIDLRDLNNWQEFEDQVKNINPDVLALSVSYLDLKPSLTVMEKVRTINPKVKVVVGGILPSNSPDIVILNKDIDYIVLGEGEITFVDLLVALRGGKSFDRVTQGKVPNLDDLPFVDREIFDYRHELNCAFAPGQQLPVITMIAGRGCSFQCTYCQPAEKKVFPGRFRIRSPENVIAELKILRDKYSFNSITWWDDTFTIDRDWVFRFCDLCQKEGFSAGMDACSRADIICNNEDMVSRLASVGMKCFVIGFETGTQRILDFLKKGTTVEQNLKAAEICRRYGIKVYATVMLGLPTETKEDAKATMEMIKKAHPDIVNLFYFTPIPGTEIYEYCIKNNLMLRDDSLDISRTGDYRPKIKGIDYQYLDSLRGA